MGRTRTEVEQTVDSTPMAAETKGARGFRRPRNGREGFLGLCREQTPAGPSLDEASGEGSAEKKLVGGLVMYRVVTVNYMP